MSDELQPVFDISVVVTAHAEGRLAHRTMRSVQAAVDEAIQHGLRLEIIVVLDNPTAETRAYFATWSDRARVMEVSNRDLGLNRNAAVAVARGKYIAFLDADDCFGRSWLRLAIDHAFTLRDSHFAIHPETGPAHTNPLFR